MGTGHPWPVLSAERGAQDLVTGQASLGGPAARGDDRDVRRRRSGSRAGLGRAECGGVAVRHRSDHSPQSASSTASRDGSAAPLTWGAGSQVRLTADLSAGRVLEQPAQTVDRYITHTQIGDHAHGDVAARPDGRPPTRFTSPARRCPVRPSMWPTSVRRTTTHASGNAAADGSFSFDIAAARRQQRLWWSPAPLRTAVRPRPFARSSTTSSRARCCSTAPTRTATTTGRATTPTRRRRTSTPVRTT